MPYHFTSDSKTDREIADQDGNIVAFVIRTRGTSYYLLGPDSLLIRSLPFCEFDRALAFFIEEREKLTDKPGVKK